MGTCLKLDIDNALNKHEMKRIATVLEMYSEHTGNKISDIEVFSTRNGFHVYIYLQKLISNASIVALQAILGSDYRRETFNLLRITKNPNNQYWNVLFNKKYRYSPKSGRFTRISQEVRNRHKTRKLKEMLKP